MRARAAVLSTVVGVTVVLVPFTATAAPTTTPTVTPVRVAGNGPLDLYRTGGLGFTPGHTVAITLEDGTAARALGSVTVTKGGYVVVPGGSRIPSDVTPGAKTVLMTQDDGVTAMSPAFAIDAPAMTAPAVVQSRALDTVFDLTGLANTPDVQRSLTVDGRPLAGVRWYSDSRSFDDPDIHASLPALSVGQHTVTFTQTVQTPFTASATVRVVPATVAVPAEAATRQDLTFTVTGAGREDVLDVTVVGAGRDRHPLGTIRVFDNGTTDRVTLDGVSPGRATATFVSTQTGGTSTATFTVLPTSVTAPAGLDPAGHLASPEGFRHLQMQTDGNLVARVYGTAVWSTRTAGHPGARLRVQDDGNVVIRDKSGRALWSTSTAGTGRGGHLVVESYSITLTTAGGRRVWSSFPATNLNPLTAGQYLARGETRTADLTAGPPFGSLYLTMQPDGNLTYRVDTGASRVLWQTRTGGHPNAYAALQSDGNLVVRGPDGRAIWANNVRPGAGARLVLQSDGNLVERAANGRVVWSTGTVVG